MMISIGKHRFSSPQESPGSLNQSISCTTNIESSSASEVIAIDAPGTVTTSTYSASARTGSKKWGDYSTRTASHDSPAIERQDTPQQHTSEHRTTICGRQDDGTRDNCEGREDIETSESIEASAQKEEDRYFMYRMPQAQAKGTKIQRSVPAQHLTRRSVITHSPAPTVSLEISNPFVITRTNLPGNNSC